jgi:hypothetical protein
MRGNRSPDKEFRSSESPCRHGARTISSARCRTELVGVWPLRIPEPRPRPPVHPLCDSGDPVEAVFAEMRPRLHHSRDGDERLEVGALRGDQWMFFEERHDHRHQVAPSLHGETKQRMAMVVVASVLDDLPAPEHLLEEFECRASTAPPG